MNLSSRGPWAIGYILSLACSRYCISGLPFFPLLVKTECCLRRDLTFGILEIINKVSFKFFYPHTFIYIYTCAYIYINMQYINIYTHIHIYIICDRILIVVPISLVECLGFWTTRTRINLPFNLTGRGDHSLQFWTAKQCLVPSHSAYWRVKK